jgi:Mg2+-importing ATPase
MTSKQLSPLSTAEILKALSATPTGLSAAQARQLLLMHGSNTLENTSPSGWQVLLRQFRSSIIYLLIVSSALSFLLGDVLDGTAIAVIIVLNATLGFIQEFKSEKAIEKLTKLIGKDVLVVRDEKNAILDEKELVPGDVIILKEGDIVPADCRLLEAHNVSINESQLTGESAAIAKNTTTVANIFAGSIMEKGIGTALVFATGSQTELGSIATLSGDTKKVTPFEKSLQDFSNFLIKVTLFTLAAVFATKLLLVHDLTHFTSLLLFIVALALAVVPEVLPVIVTVTLSSGALKLAKKHVIVKKISALEDLGNINLLCTDKTGTLTENKLSIKKLESSNEELFKQLATACIDDFDEKHRDHLDSFDSAFLDFIPASERGAEKQYSIVEQLPFDPVERRRKVVLKDAINHTYHLVELGSAETLLSISHTPYTARYLKQITEDGTQGLRHHAIAYKEIEKPEKDFDILQHERDLAFLGFVTLEDPLRPTARHTIEVANKLGVRIKILSGDSKEVSGYIAHQIGLIEEGGLVYTGEELASMSHLEFEKAVEECHVFARITPEQKYEIIKALKLHNTVGYQGDGINDAPALKLADVAIAVNTATDVAKENADIILLRQDLGVIISGIQYGRAIFQNINKYIRHTMVGNFGQLFALSAIYLLSPTLPLLTIQLLLAFILVDLPLVTIASDTVKADDLKRPEQYDIRALMLISLVLGSITSLFSLMFYALARSWPIAYLPTAFFLFITLTELVNIFSVRTKVIMWRGNRPSFLISASTIGVMLVTLVLPYLDFLRPILSFEALPVPLLAFTLAATALYLLSLDVVKNWYYQVISEHKA